MTQIYRHVMLVEIETDNADLDVQELQESVLEKLDALEGVNVATVEDRQVVTIHRKTP